jgi:hypothetical protein
MKIIKNGNIEKIVVKVKIKDCWKCDAKLEYSSSDIHSDFRDGAYIICPCCKSFITV